EGLRILQALRDALGELDEARDELAALMATRFGVSVREIAKASGVSTATLYRRIDTTKKNDRTGS
ncbi:HTH domain-containing protein, partial [Kocuria turfanensis]|uniref:HTH domain-containing protein n=1 Tax=Kocuria turfanensis TaxID=388357 RepID=UPI0011BEC884